MLKEFLAGNVVYTSISHSEIILKKYFELFEEVFYKINNLDNRDILNLKLNSETSFSFRK